jgi:transcription initiation factor TFIIA large subunit
MLSEPQVDSEAINSDLDDSDTEGEEEAEEGTAGETDIVFCTYDKVSVLVILLP